jgi:glycosyltransferase involved in cell wall biosynthesis
MLSVRPDIRVLLVGGGPQEKTLREQAKRLGLLDKIVFAGRVPHERVQKYYGLVDVFAYPRHSMRLTELVTPLKPLEAMAQGHVFVASDVGGHRELVRHGETGMLVRAGSSQALAEGLLAVLDDPNLRERLRVAGRRYIESERSWAASVARYAPIYERLAGQR